MIRIIDGKSTGKTQRLLLTAKENDGIIACSNPEHLRAKAYEYGLTGMDFISYADLMFKDYEADRKVYIDELDEFIVYFNHMIDGYTLSVD